MIRLAGSAIALAVGIGCLALPSGALASSGNATATLAYLRADHAFLHQVIVRLPAERAALNTFIANVTDECPKIAAEAPMGPGLGELAEESFDAAAIAFEHPVATAAITFARDIAHLQWSNRKLARLVRLYATTERAEAMLTPPHLCSDLKEWAADGYGAPPSSTRRFLKEAEASNPESTAPDEEILRQLAPYAHGSIKTLWHSVESLAARTVQSIGLLALTDFGRLDEGLGLLRTNAEGPPPT